MNKKLVIFDMDGTLYLGKNLFPYTKNTLKYLKDNDIDYLFFTNNSSHDLDFYLKKMRGFDIECDMSNFYSSSEVTISYLKRNNIKKIFLLGNKSLKDQFKKEFDIVTSYKEDEDIEAVVIGFSTELVYDELRSACLYLETRKDIRYIATNGDYRCPIEDGLYIPDCGGMAEWIYLVTGRRPLIMGKPSKEVIESILDTYHLNKEDILVVGDRMYTDILVGVNAGVDSLLVLSGESTMEDVNKSPYKPTYILDSIEDLPKLLKDK